MSAANVSSLQKTFLDFWHRPRVTAVHDVSLSVPYGCIFGLLGPNGSGKSTTIKLMLGLLRPTRGSVSVLGGSPRDRAIQHRIGYLPEVSTMYRYLTATETLDFYGSLFDLPASIRKERTSQLLTLTGLTAAAHRPVGEFSRGMNRRLGLAQALLNNPDLLILDEPTAGLDPIGCHHVKQLLSRLSQAGKTVIIASHLLADIEDICRQVAILHHGRVIANGPIDALLKHTDQTVFTAEGALDTRQTEKISKLVKKLTGAPPVLQPARISLESFFVQAVLRAGQPERAASTTDSEELLLPAFLEGSSPS